MSRFDFNKFLKTFAIFVSTASYCFCTPTDRVLPPFIDHYEVVEYKVFSLEENDLHGLIKRSWFLRGLTFNFTAFGREFSVIARPNERILQPNAQITVISKRKEKTKSTKESLVYEGELKDELGSRVSGYIVNGAFSGVITTKSRETFYVEPLKNYGDDTEVSESSSARAMVYRPKDINQNFKNNYEVRLHRGELVPPKIRSKHIKRVAKQHNSCPVLLAADSLFYKKVGNEQEAETLATMSYHLFEADRLFRRTQFTEGGHAEGIGLVIAAMMVFKDRESEGILSSPENIEVEKYLSQWSKMNHGSYCLSLLFTYRDFPDGVLGLAWLADMHGLGGVCEPWSPHYNQSLNTAVVTFSNKGRLMPIKLGTLTVAHELGHGFGAKHDPEECQPNGNEGNYLMYKYTTDTGHPNNDRFSSCSIRDMREIIEAKAHRCFIDGASYCGNRIVESTEECDCGNIDDCEKYDHCCMAKDEKNGINGCTLKPTVQCSPKASPCCASNCQFINDSERKVCHEETECSFPSFCVNGSCPAARSKADNKICNHGSSVCKDGHCSGSICLLYNHTECPCVDPSNSCNVCCRNSQGDCVSSKEFHGRIVPQPAEKACEINGFCDGTGQCIEHIDEPEKTEPGVSFQKVLNWIKKKWFVFIGMGMAILAQVLFRWTGGFRQCCIRRRATASGQLELVQIGHGSQRSPAT